MAALHLEGKVAVVTGSSRGWGRGIAEELAARRAKLIVHGSKAETVEATVSAIRASGGTAEGIARDLADPAGPEAVVQAALDRFGRIDILVNNAGRLSPAPLVEMTDAQWDDVVAVQLTAQFRASRAAARAMIAQGDGGRIVSMVGGGGFTGFFENANHCASKGGGMGAVLTWAQELAPHGITLNGVAGMVETDLVRPLQDRVRARLKAAGEQHHISARDLGSYPPREAAAIVVWLASAAAARVTGQFFESRGPMIGLWRMAMLERSWHQFPCWSAEDIEAAGIGAVAAGPLRIEPTHAANAVVALRD